MFLSFVLLAQLLGLAQASISSGCPTSGPVSCQISATRLDTCCNEYPGGLLLQTQVWDTDVPGSPVDSWTIGGLMNSKCDGSYMGNCDPSRKYDISQLLVGRGDIFMLDYMRKYWLNNNGTNEELWNKQWLAHGTCFSTLDPLCLPRGGSKGAEAVAYCDTVIRIFRHFPTYSWLGSVGITPSDSETYKLSAILSALKSGSDGFTPYVACTDGNLDTVIWYFNVKGSVIDGTFIPINSPASFNTCPDDGIKYLPKSG